MYIDNDFWYKKKIFITGHTGFKGSWLSLILSDLGCEVKGFSLSPYTNPSLYNELGPIKNHISIISNITKKNILENEIINFGPDILIHMAAQPLVRHSYADPYLTYETNVIGTINVLEACRKCKSIKTILNVTTDKVYENKEWCWGYREYEKLGGKDPYSSSKSCSELVTSAYYESFFKSKGLSVASARAGNVIGGGDWSDDRLIPDLLKSIQRKETVELRYPNAVRPWQHVIEPIFGYLVLIQYLFSNPEKFSGAWNFGPLSSDTMTVKEVVETFISKWPGGGKWKLFEGEKPHEASNLYLDTSKSRKELKYKSIWGIEKTISLIIDWHVSFIKNVNANELCRRQIDEFINDSKLKD